jgi:major membrane immunogen (membrane-anchored lipoprotein)
VIYGHVGIKELIELSRGGRCAVVIPDVQVSDIEEYINCCSATLAQHGVDTNWFTQPKLLKYNNTKNIVFIARKAYNTECLQSKQLRNWTDSMDRAETLDNYLRDICIVYNKKPTVHDIGVIKCLYRNITNNSKAAAFVDLTIEEDSITKAKLRFTNKHSCIISEEVSDCNNNIKQIITKLSKTAYRNYKINIEYASVAVKDRIYEYTIKSTDNQVNMTLVN